MDVAPFMAHLRPVTLDYEPRERLWLRRWTFLDWMLAFSVLLVSVGALVVLFVIVALNADRLVY